MNKTVLLLSSVLAVGNAIADAPTQLDVIQRNAESNELKILDNRFRIDHQVEEITLLFFRKKGSPAVILIRPDGSKIYATQSIRDRNIEWIDEQTYDIIKMKKPMAGPWQVVGQILPNSRLLILSDIELNVAPLPPLMFKGETIKMTGQLTNGGEPVESGYFRDLVNLNVDFVSTNNKDYFNFGADPVHVAEFRDDGKDFDERAGDAVFTGEFKLDFAPGEWTPEFELATPLLTRQVSHAAVVVDPMPLTFDFKPTKEAEERHQLTITIDETKVKPETVVFQGRTYYPNGEEQSFTLDAKATNQRLIELVNYDWGVYSVELSIFATNINGREFMADLTKQAFEIKKPIEAVPEMVEPDIEIMPEQEIPEVVEEPKMAKSTLITIVVFANLLILLLGAIFIRVFIQKKSLIPKLNFSFRKKKTLDDEQNSGSSARNLDKGDEILNLSMPDE